jgi:DNA-binding NarL/FixJ family response regulator
MKQSSITRWRGCVLAAYPIIGIDLHDHKLELARKLGATHTLNARQGDLRAAIREIAGGNAFFSPPVAKRLLKQWQETLPNGSPVRAKATTLTSRQTEVLQLVAEGYPNKQIGDLLSLSIKTVEKHRQDLMNTLNIHNIASLTRYAVSSGVVESNRIPNWSTTAVPRAIA